MKEKILEVLERNSRISLDQLAVMLDTSTEAVKTAMKEMEEAGVVLGYHTLIDWEKTSREVVAAMIEVKVTPQRGIGFDKVAERISQYAEVRSVFLISGGFDLLVEVTGSSMKDVALFVAQKLAPMEGVESCATHFMLKKYKENGIPFAGERADTRAAIWL